MRDINPDYMINLYRSGGTEAFTDNSTIITVNSLLENQRFEPRFETKNGGTAPDMEFFATALGPPPERSSS